MAASRTAQFVAFYRALETVERRRPPLFRDPFASLFLDSPLARTVKAARLPGLHTIVERYADHRAPGARTSAIGRTKIIDDVLREAATAGVEQFVVLGAGFDTRAHRLPELAGSAVYEVDRPETQERKRERLRAVPGVRDDVHYVSVDFLRDTVPDRLAAEGWDAARPSCFVWEGVTNYLTAEAVHAMLEWIGRTAPKGILVVTYVHKGLLDGSMPFDGGERIMGNVRSLGEPWTFGLYPNEVAPLLTRFGMTLRDDVGADDYRSRTGLNGATGYAFYRLAVADISSTLPL
jgi:methyltransferase (TIGR00027 family)